MAAVVSVEQQQKDCLKQISLWCASEMHRTLGVFPMAVVGGRAVDYYLGTDNAADTDVAVCVPTPEGYVADPRDFIYASPLQNNAAFLILRNLLMLFTHIDRMWSAYLRTLFPIVEGSVLPATVVMGAGHRLSMDLERMSLGNGTPLPVSQDFPFCVLVIPDSERRDHVLITVRMRTQKGTITHDGRTFPNYPGILDFAIKRPALFCNVQYVEHYPILFQIPPLPYVYSSNVPYITVISLVESQIILVNNIAEGERKISKTARLRALWEGLSGFLSTLLKDNIPYYSDIESRVTAITGPIAAEAEEAVEEAEGAVEEAAVSSNKKGGARRKTKSRQIRKKRRTNSKK